MLSLYPALLSNDIFIGLQEKLISYSRGNREKH
jgi:hypothetical protein